MSYEAESASEYVVPMTNTTETLDLGYYAPGFSLFMEGVSGTGSLTVEISANGSDWVLPTNSVLIAKDAALAEGDNAAYFSSWARHLRLTRTGVSAMTVRILARKAAR